MARRRALHLTGPTTGEAQRCEALADLYEQRMAFTHHDFVAADRNEFNRASADVRFGDQMHAAGITRLFI